MKGKILYTVLIAALIALLFWLPALAKWGFSIALAITVIGRWFEE